MENIEKILNDCLNKAICQKGRVRSPNSNEISKFVSSYLNLTDLSNLFTEHQIKNAFYDGYNFRDDNGLPFDIKNYVDIQQ